MSPASQGGDSRAWLRRDLSRLVLNCVDCALLTQRSCDHHFLFRWFPLATREFGMCLYSQDRWCFARNPERGRLCNVDLYLVPDLQTMDHVGTEKYHGTCFFLSAKWLSFPLPDLEPALIGREPPRSLLLLTTFLGNELSVWPVVEPLRSSDDRKWQCCARARGVCGRWSGGSWTSSSGALCP